MKTTESAKTIVSEPMADEQRHNEAKLRSRPSAKPEQKTASVSWLRRRFFAGNDRFWAQAMLFAVAIVWGSSYGVSKNALVFYPVLGFLALRFLMTFALLLPSFIRLSYADQRRSIVIGAPLGMLLAAIFACETYGLSLTSASNAAFLISLCMVLTPLAEWLLLGQQPTQRTWFCLSLALAGAALLSGTIADLAAFNLGDGLILCAAVLRAFVVVLTRKLTKNHPAPALALTTVQAGIVGSTMLILALVNIPMDQLALPAAASFWVNMIYLILFCTVFAFFAQNWAASRIAPTRVSVLMGLEPLFGALYGVIALGEVMSNSAISGAALMLIAIFALSLPRQPSEHALRSVTASGKAGSQ